MQSSATEHGVLFRIGRPRTRSGSTDDRDAVPRVSAIVPSYVIVQEEAEVYVTMITSSLNVNTYEVRLLTTSCLPHPLAAQSQLRSATQRPPPPYNPRCISSTEIFGDLLAWSASTDPGQILVWNWKTGDTLLVCSLRPRESHSYLTHLVFSAAHSIRRRLVLQVPR